LLIEKLPELVKTQVEAVKNIKIDKITVWDSGNNQDGNGSTANFVSGMMKTVPPLNDLFNMAGLNLPTYLKGDDKTEEVNPTKVVDASDDITPTEEVK
jgi:flotillin